MQEARFILEEVDDDGRKDPNVIEFQWLRLAMAMARSGNRPFGYGWEAGGRVFVLTVGKPFCNYMVDTARRVEEYYGLA